MARAALGWSTDKLAAEAKVGRATVHRFEQGGDARQSSLDAIRLALEVAGIEFIPAGQQSAGGGPGVRLRQDI
jgi:transcriptional regulator with XRE-family HTH domain